ncbi:hypothetical protein L195_g031957 [Trifolium pratense]|uniref:Uncharacterized protein n=1 Tax=Trifolium pratense TaxID=57577 RepID=A0A2K3LBV1_TRIPR|nr:hypothetical protein L195_g031957 [Trifolium pratense]
MAATSHSFFNCATYLDLESAQEIDGVQGSCVHKILSNIHTFHMEYDPHSDPNHNEIQVSVLKTTSNDMFFEQGWLVLRDFYDIWFGGWLSFTYINSNLLSISLTTRWGIDVRYPLHYPRKRIMLANTIVGASAGTSAPHSSPPSGPVLSSPFLRSYLKKLTLYDVKSGAALVWLW